MYPETNHGLGESSFSLASIIFWQKNYELVQHLF
jgi:hypothetical protein